MDTKPEMALRRELSRRGLRYRVDYSRASGRPDLAMVGRRLAIFVDGEFWHGKKLSAARLAEMPEYWQRKIRRNADRDIRVNAALISEGWTVVRITDRAISRDLSGVANFVERTAMGQRCGVEHPDPEYPGIEIHYPQP